MENKTLTIKEKLLKLTKELEVVAFEEAALEARLLLLYAMNMKNEELILSLNNAYDAKYDEKLDKALKRRLLHEPIQYILGSWEFMGLEFRVDKRVLIPRQDSETLVEHALELIKEKGYKSVLDMCTGSGCMGISLKKIADADVTLADISGDALDVAKENAALNGVNVKTVESDLFENIDGKFDLIVTNPPYLTHEDMNALQSEVEYEPKLALFGGDDGLEVYRRIAKEAVKYLNEGGAILLEVGIGQAEDVCDMFEERTYTVKDLNRIERVVVCLKG